MKRFMEYRRLTNKRLLALKVSERVEALLDSVLLA